MHGQPHAQPASHRLNSICSGRECLLGISNNLNNVYAYLWQWTKKIPQSQFNYSETCVYTLYQISHTRKTTEFPCHQSCYSPPLSALHRDTLAYKLEWLKLPNSVSSNYKSDLSTCSHRGCLPVVQT